MSDVITITPEVAVHVQASIAYCAPCDEYVVTYTNQWANDDIDLYAQRVRAADGALLDMNIVASGEGWNRLFPQVVFHPDMYGGAGGYLIAYFAETVPTSGERRVRYKITHTELYDLFVNPEVDISSTSGEQSPPQAAAGEMGFLIAYWESDASGVQVRARRINANGVALWQPEGFPVSSEYATAYFWNVAVTYAYPGLYLVLWEHETPTGIVEIHGIFVSENADTTLGDEFALSGSGTNLRRPVAICSPMSDCLFAYEWWNPPSDDIAGDIARLVVMFEDGFESGDTSAWSATVP